MRKVKEQKVPVTDHSDWIRDNLLNDNLKDGKNISEQQQTLVKEFGLPHQELETLENDLAFHLPMTTESFSS